jgi:hypothetical protein
MLGVTPITRLEARHDKMRDLILILPNIFDVGKNKRAADMFRP